MFFSSLLRVFLSIIAHLLKKNESYYEYSAVELLPLQLHCHYANSLQTLSLHCNDTLLLLLHCNDTLLMHCDDTNNFAL